MKENTRILEHVQDYYPLFWLSHEIKPSCEGLKEIGVDVDEI